MIDYFLFSHAFLGGIALLFGLVALVTRKGSKTHKFGGKVFFWSMLISGLIAMVISWLPDHTSPFLFAIGVFSLYLISSGYLAIRYKKPHVNLTFDKVLSLLMAITALGMILTPVILSSELNIVLLVFGAIGLTLSIQDLRTYSKPDQLRQKWLQAHLGKMVGGYIAAVTAFVVVNEVLPSLVAWLAPTVIGTTFIIYWTRKVSKTKI